MSYDCNLKDFIDNFGYRGLVATASFVVIEQLKNIENLVSIEDLTQHKRAEEFVLHCFYDLAQEFQNGCKFKRVYELYNYYIEIDKEIFSILNFDNTSSPHKSSNNARKTLSFILDLIRKFTYDEEMALSLKSDITLIVYRLLKAGYFLHHDQNDGYVLSLCYFQCKKNRKKISVYEKSIEKDPSRIKLFKAYLVE